MTAPEVSQHIDADDYHVQVDLEDKAAQGVPALLRALRGREDELRVFLHSQDRTRRAMALVDLTEAIRTNAPAILSFSPTEALDLADALRGAAVEPDLCPRAGCQRYAVSCDVHGGAEFVAEPTRWAS